MFSLQAVLLILTVTLFIMTGAIISLLSQSKQHLNFVVAENQRLQVTIQRQWNLLLSKDPMTLATMTSLLESSTSNQNGVTPVGTDEDEAKRYAAMYGLGEVTPQDDDDSYELGLLTGEHYT